MATEPRGGAPGASDETLHTLPPEAPLMQVRVHLTWRDAEGEHRSTVEERVVLGSAEGAGLRVVDRAVSRVHAELEPRRDGLWVRDLGSRNGTTINDVPIERARVPRGGRLKVGGVEVSVAYDAVPVALETAAVTRFGRLVGQSSSMRALFASLARVAKSDGPVLVRGETGTGKELVASAIHEASERAGKPFVVVDCGALPENLLDAELFGHVKGAFTGAVGTRAGAFEEADGGTVFLDEIGELPLSMQPKLLRVLESRTVRRLGEARHRPVDIRVVAATHRDLLRMVAAGEFREDLYFRLAVLPISVPSLRERLDDLEVLVRHFDGASVLAARPDFKAELAKRAWRGNVRELRNVVERAKAMGPEATVRELLGEEMATLPSVAVAEDAAADPAPPPVGSDETFDGPYRVFRDRWNDRGEREYVRRLLARHAGNTPSAAREAEIDRTYMYRLVRKHGG